MILKIPVVGHISLDLGYIVLAVFCYLYGPAVGAAIGAGGCTIVSLLASGWFPIGWLLGNLFIGWLCGKRYRESESVKWMDFAWTITAVVVGILGIKTVIECCLYGIPLLVKLPKNLIAAVMDAAVMCMGVALAPRIRRIVKKTICSDL